jgi:mRNA-degrading endonuclease RelE of RelBE toxin-antitoxin system
LAYNVEFTRQAEKELRDILQDINESGRRSFQRAFQALQTNPYPTNPEVSPGTIRRLRGSNEWSSEQAITESGIPYREIE